MVEVRRIDLDKPGELDNTIAMVSRVFFEFVAPDYSPEGVTEFLRFFEPELVRKTLTSDERQMWIALVDDSVAGAISLRNENHICLFFVDSAFHNQGIGHTLYVTARDHLRSIGR